MSNTTVDVLIVGAGFAGLYATHRFRSMGKSVLSVEAGSNVGGVWFWNRYPGARCDVMSIDYSYGFSEQAQQEWNWSEQFAAQPEILAYANFVADRLDLRRSYRFNTKVVSAHWQADESRWAVAFDTGETANARYVIMATGPLSIPKDPDVPGLDGFSGEILRAQKWPQGPVDFKGKRVGVIGTGSSGIQIIQTLGKEKCELYVFQRTPSFTFPMKNTPLSSEYMAEVKRHYPEIRQAMWSNPSGGSRPSTRRPYFSLPRHQRRKMLEQGWEDGGYGFMGAFADLLTNEAANEEVAEFVRGKIAEVVHDPETAEALKPRGYPIFARRPCLDTGYYETFNRQNVHLIDCLKTPIEEIVPAGIRTSAGLTELDVIILATGYDALTGALLALEITGRDGQTLRSKWAVGARSVFGFAMSGFPNFFAPSGPNGPAATANMVTVAEHDVNWIADLIAFADRKGAAAIEAGPAAEDEWMGIVREIADKSLISRGNTWWVGANVPGKPRGLTMFVGGFDKYRDHCDAERGRQYPRFILSGALP